MNARWRNGLIKIAIAIFTELLLNLAGMDDLANYSEFVFTTKYQSNSNERHRRKRTVYHFAPLARFAARLRSTAPLTLYWTDAAELRGINPQRLKELLSP